MDEFKATYDQNEICALQKLKLLNVFKTKITILFSFAKINWYLLIFETHHAFTFSEFWPIYTLGSPSFPCFDSDSHKKKSWGVGEMKAIITIIIIIGM